ncbi:hypothetical protein [Parvularcula lutaonensis]|uniref:Uncharacterized protein n=1 Tax=Parvularcula lutaonensis TaxID=491923 RepID=A0ABV7M9C4_9PROT|nr:hypothetical protein [Parvularcula lutaonensis]GGY46897.1 hypothetical protein GCM10007148_15090 [Parvularcula lutaonensis]
MTTRRSPSWLDSVREFALDTLPGSGAARAIYGRIRAEIRKDLEDELDALMKERERDQQTIARLAEVVERQQAQLERATERLVPDKVEAQASRLTR